jgi:hypothetical protein
MWFMSKSRSADEMAMKLALLLAVVAALTLSIAGPAGASDTRACGNLTVKLGRDFEGGAWQIRATRISCERARSVARACVRGRRGDWFMASTSRTVDGIEHTRTIMDHPQGKTYSRISFEVVGGGGCG